MPTINQLPVPLTQAEIQPLLGAQSIYKEAGLSVPDRNLPQRVSDIVAPYLRGEQAIYLKDMDELRDVTTFLTMATELSEDDHYQRVAEQILYANQLDYRISRFGDPTNFSLRREDVVAEAEVDTAEATEELAERRHLEDLELTGNVESADTVQYVAEVIGLLKENMASLKDALQERIEAAQEKYRKEQELADERRQPMVDAAPEISGAKAAEMIEGVRERAYEPGELGELLNYIRSSVHLMTRDANRRFVEFLRDETVRAAVRSAEDGVDREQLPGSENDPHSIDHVINLLVDGRVQRARMMRGVRAIAFNRLGADYYLHQSLDLIGSWADGDEDAFASMLTPERWQNFTHVERGFVRRYMRNRGSLLARFHAGGKLLKNLIWVRALVRRGGRGVEASYLTFLSRAQSVLPPAGDIAAHGAYRLFMEHTIDEALALASSDEARTRLEAMRAENDEALRRLEYEACERAGIDNERSRELERTMKDVDRFGHSERGLFARWDVITREDVDALSEELFHRHLAMYRVDGREETPALNRFVDAALPLARIINKRADAMTREAVEDVAFRVGLSLGTLNRISANPGTLRDKYVGRAVHTVLGMRRFSEALHTLFWAAYGGDSRRTAFALTPVGIEDLTLTELSMQSWLIGFNIESSYGGNLRALGAAEASILTAFRTMNDRERTAHQALDLMRKIDPDAVADNPAVRFAYLLMMKDCLSRVIDSLASEPIYQVEDFPREWEQTVGELWDLNARVSADIIDTMDTLQKTRGEWLRHTRASLSAGAVPREMPDDDAQKATSANESLAGTLSKPGVRLRSSQVRQAANMMRTMMRYFRGS